MALAGTTRFKAVRKPAAVVSEKPKTKTMAQRRATLARSFAHQLTSGIAGWLTYEQMQAGVDNLREAELAKPIELIARGRGFEIEGEFPLPRTQGQRGATRRLDFLLVHRRKKLVIAIETKYKKTGKKMAGSIGEDAKRLALLTLDEISKQIKEGRCRSLKEDVDGYTLLRVVLVVWHQSAIMEQIDLENTEIKRQFIDLVKALLPEGVEAGSKSLAQAMLGVIPTRPCATTAGSLRPGSTYTYKRFWVASLIQRSAWARL